MCYEPEVSGLCNRNRAHVSLLSRTISLTKAQRAVLMGHLDLACIEDGHIEQANTGKGYQYQPLPLNFRFSDSKQVIQFFKWIFISVFDEPPSIPSQYPLKQNSHKSLKWPKDLNISLFQNNLSRTTKYCWVIVAAVFHIWCNIRNQNLLTFPTLDNTNHYF